MRNRAFLSLLSVMACGHAPPKQADSSEYQEPHEEAAPKWEVARPPPPPLSHDDAQDNNQPRGSMDTYDKAGTEVVLKRASRQVKENCGAAKDENGKATGPWGKGNVSIRLGFNGHTREVTVPPPFEGTPPGRCVLQAFSNLTFPPWSGPDTVVEWPIEIVHIK